MRIALFTPDLRNAAGGPPRVVLQSAAALAARGHVVTIFAFARDPAALPGIEIIVRASDRPAAIGRSAALYRDVAARIDDFDVLHVHSIWEAAAADLAGLFAAAGKPVYVSAHGMLDHWSMRQSRLKKALVARLLWTRRLFQSASGLIFATAEEAGEAVGIARSVPRLIVPNGIDPAATRARIDAQLPAMRARLPLCATWGRTIVYLSRLHPKKGIDQLVEARLALPDAYDDVGMLIIGIPQDEDLHRAVTTRIDESRLVDRFILTTDLIGPAAIAALGLAEIFALPSHQEGFSIAILEAMAAGLPVLITDKCHLPEVEEWNAGAVVPDTVAGLRDGLERLLAKSPDALRQMGQRAADAVAAHYTWPIIAERLETIYSGASRS